MKKDFTIFLVFSLFSAAYGINNYTIQEFKLTPDSIQLDKIGIDLLSKLSTELPKSEPCPNEGWRSLRQPLSSQIKITKTKTNTIDFKTIEDFYNISESGKHLLSFKTRYEPTGSAILSQFSWSNNWVIEYRDHVILNGVDLNGQYNYSTSFCFNFFKNKPAYFFEKSGKSYLLIDSTIIPLKFKNIIHYYCCEPAIFNPKFDDCRITFYARKNGYWYCVLIIE